MSGLIAQVSNLELNNQIFSQKIDLRADFLGIRIDYLLKFGKTSFVLIF